MWSDRTVLCAVNSQACNHNRIIDDIGVVQIPKKIKNRWGDTVHIDFAFGREYQSKKLSDYDVVGIPFCNACFDLI